jgi:hypothetical protein
MSGKIDFEQIVKEISQVMIVLDPELNIVWVNKKSSGSGRGRSGGT